MGTDAAIYQRVSDGTDDSVEQQNEQNEEAARREGWTYALYSDKVSASRYSRRPRPDWERLLDDVKAGRYRYVILWESSRGDRKLATWAAFLDACRETDTRIYITSHGRVYDMAIGRDWRSLAEDGVDNAYEVEKTSVRVRRGVAYSATKGIPYGRIPYGYARRYERVEGRAKLLPIQYPHPDEAPIAREIITRIARNDSLTGLVRDLTNRGITRRDGKPWAHSSIARMILEGVVYIGKRRHDGGELLSGNWEPLVDEDVYWAAVAVMSDPARRSTAERRGGGIRPGAVRWLLSYIAKCDTCGASLGVVTNRMRNGKPDPQYRCANNAASHCYAPVEWVDWLIGEAVVRWCAHPLVYETLTAVDDREAQAARDEAKAERARLAGFEEQAITGKLSAEAYARIATGIESRIAELEERANAVGVPAELRDILGGRERDIAERWLAMPLTAQRSVIRKIAAPTLQPTGRGGQLLDPSRLSVNFTVKVPAVDFSRSPLLPLPALLASPQA